MNSCDGCIFYGIRDDGYGPYERHDHYCAIHDEWLPERCPDWTMGTTNKNSYERKKVI